MLITEHQPDGVERPIFDAHDSGRSLWDTCAVEAYFPPESDVRAALLAASEALGRPLEYAAEAVLTQDWVDAIRAEYRPVEACDGVWVVPAGLQVRARQLFFFFPLKGAPMLA